GREFNKMSAELEAHIAEAERKREELEEAIRRVGEAVGAGLDREGVVALVVRTTVGACGAEAGRALPIDPPRMEYCECGLDGTDIDFVGVISIARRDREFTEQERELFAYLAGQATLSIENVDLHETVQQQAVTDELTGLFNVREFHSRLDGEIERAERFGTPLSLVMLDIDKFKSVNDTYGHQQGDRVLVEVARVLRRLSRDVDLPARYGGEELAVVLP